MRTRTLALLCVAVITAAVPLSLPVRHAARGWAAPAASPSATRSPSPSPSSHPPVGSAHLAAQPAPPAPTLLLPADPASITASGAIFFGWTLIDRRTGQSGGSANRETVSSTTESMLKAWIAADYLRHQTGKPNASTLAQLNTMIVDSDDNIAHDYYVQDGGDASITELVSVCGLTNTHRPSLPGNWSYTTISPADAARMGLCIGNGTAAGPQWTDWLLTAMRNVRGTVDQQQASTGGGRWGIIDGLPANLVAGTAIKNGWTAQIYDHNWHVNCLAINPDWVLAIELQYPWTSPTGKYSQANNLRQGAQTCESVTKQLVAVPAG